MSPDSSARTDPPVWRRLFHLVAGSSIPIAGIFVASAYMVIGLAVLSAGALALDLVRFRVEWLNRHFLRWLAPLLKGSETNRITGATYLIIAALAVFGLFDSTIAVVSLLFLSLGDPAAALVGRAMPAPGYGASRPEARPHSLRCRWP